MRRGRARHGTLRRARGAERSERARHRSSRSDTAAAESSSAAGTPGVGGPSPPRDESPVERGPVWAISLGPQAAIGFAPRTDLGVDIGVGLSLAVERDLFRALLRGSAFLPTESTVEGTRSGGDFSLLAAGAFGCLGPTVSNVALFELPRRQALSLARGGFRNRRGRGSLDDDFRRRREPRGRVATHRDLLSARWCGGRLRARDRPLRDRKRRARPRDRAAFRESRIELGARFEANSPAAVDVLDELVGIAEREKRSRRRGPSASSPGDRARQRRGSPRAGRGCAPKITEDTAGLASNHASAIWLAGFPGSLAAASSASTIFQLCSVSKVLYRSFHSERRLPAGGAWLRRYLPLNRPLASGDQGKMPSPCRTQSG